MTKIFITYRRGDDAGIVGRMYDRLVDHFGRDAIFMDVDSIPLGVDFREHIRRIMKQCAVQLVIIGPHWLTVTDETGHRRLDNADDPVRLEVDLGFECSLAVIPLLVDGAGMPTRQQLPPILAPLADRNGRPVRHADFDYDMQRIIEAVGQWVRPQWRGVAQHPPMLSVPHALPTTQGARRTTKAAFIWIAAGLLILLVAAGVLVASYFASLQGGNAPSVNAQPTNTPVPVFHTNQTYGYNYYIGHSKPNQYTSDKVSVTLLALQVSTSDGTSVLTVRFEDFDTQLGTDFAFEGLPNVYLVDNFGYRYQGATVTPPEIILSPGQSGILTVGFPLIHTNVTSLQVFVNTDRFALDTQCALLTPDQVATTCPV